MIADEEEYDKVDVDEQSPAANDSAASQNNIPDTIAAVINIFFDFEFKFLWKMLDRCPKKAQS